jgi:hypothetical protein
MNRKALSSAFFEIEQGWAMKSRKAAAWLKGKGEAGEIF